MYIYGSRGMSGNGIFVVSHSESGWQAISSSVLDHLVKSATH